jgi:hypothetical protein
MEEEFQTIVKFVDTVVRLAIELYKFQKQLSEAEIEKALRAEMREMPYSDAVISQISKAVYEAVQTKVQTQEAYDDIKGANKMLGYQLKEEKVDRFFQNFQSEIKACGLDRTL